MAEEMKNAENSDEAREKAVNYQRQAPIESETHGMERAPSTTSLEEDIRARTNHPHKGDVGRPGTNEEVFQGSKTKEVE